MGNWAGFIIFLAVGNIIVIIMHLRMGSVPILVSAVDSFWSCFVRFFVVCCSRHVNKCGCVSSSLSHTGQVVVTDW